MWRHSSALGFCFVLCTVASAFGQSQPRQGTRPDGRLQLCAASVVTQVEPVYPAAAKKKGVRGQVRVDVFIGKDGHVQRLEPISGSPVLVEAARQAIMQWVYKPTLRNGEPIEVNIEAEFWFPNSMGPRRTAARCG
jgi:TonB family protein